MASLTRKHLLHMRAALVALALVAYSVVAQDRSGRHDFDFLFGDWQVHHQRLKARLAGSTEWIEFDGRQSTRPALGGAGNVSENWFDMPGGAYRGVSVRSFDAESGQWAIWWLDGRDPAHALDPPMKGRFESAGTFYADDTFNGRPIRVRYIWSQITPTSAHWEQAFSPDGGKTWETNWMSDFKRAATEPAQDPPHTADTDLSGVHDFDFLVGEWRVHHRRLKERLANNRQWVEFQGTCSARLLMGGLSNVDDNRLDLPGDAYHGVTLRAYDPKSGQWAIWWVDSRSPHNALDPPVRGKFANGVGTFYANDTLRGKPIRIRFIWSQITPTSARWEQAFSPDGGKTWEVNWTMEFQRVS